jgi:hypothetical protein
MKVSLVEKVLLNIMGLCGGIALTAVIEMVCGYRSSTPHIWPLFVGVPIMVAFANWAWISIESDRP